MGEHWRQVVEFLKLHYVLSQRKERYWQDNRVAASIPQSLQDLLEFWRFHPPSIHDNQSTDQVFPFCSYQYVLFGMGFRSETPATTRSGMESAKIKECFAETARMTSQLASELPGTRELIKQIVSG